MSVIPQVFGRGNTTHRLGNIIYRTLVLNYYLFLHKSTAMTCAHIAAVSQSDSIGKHLVQLKVSTLLLLVGKIRGS
ncbi:MAG: hypothetical protein WC913_06460, partial [Desulfuromonas sp.]